MKKTCYNCKYEKSEAIGYPCNLCVKDGVKTLWELESNNNPQ